MTPIILQHPFPSFPFSKVSGMGWPVYTFTSISTCNHQASIHLSVSYPVPSVSHPAPLNQQSGRCVSQAVPEHSLTLTLPCLNTSYLKAMDKQSTCQTTQQATYTVPHYHHLLSTDAVKVLLRPAAPCSITCCPVHLRPQCKGLKVQYTVLSEAYSVDVAVSSAPQTRSPLR